MCIKLLQILPMRHFLATLFLSLTGPLAAADLKVATLHPLLADLAHQVGGDRVEVIDLIGRNGDPHHFEPSPENLQRSADATLYLASGMGLESYLKSLRGIVGKKAEIVEIGKDLPSIEGECDHEGHDHGDHEHAIDPHWWHSIDLFRRATTTTATAFAKADPAGAETYQKNAAAYRTKLDELERWTRKEIAKIPRDKRHLATAHAAFGYFCKDHGFEPIPVQGVNREQMPDPKKLAALIAELKEHQVGAIFPEKESNPKILQALTKDTGIQLGEALIADGSTAESYEAMVRHNVAAIVAGLAK
jgi:zinc/manganese transport system substrate-binding protein